MADRKDLHRELEGILGSDKVFFQPPESLKLSYPCIIYHLNNFEVGYADDGKYMSTKRYQVMLITENPVTNLVDKLHQMDYCRFDRWYTADNLNHYVYTIYY